MPSLISSRRGAAPWLCAVLFLAAACGDGGGKVVTPDPPTVASVAVTAPAAQLTAGTTMQLSATPRDAQGAAITGRTITWASSAEGVATVSGGLVTAVAPGTAAIRATADGKTGEVVLTVIPVPIATISIIPTVSTVTVGGFVDLQVVALDAAGNPLPGRQITLSTSEPAVAGLQGTRVIALAPGVTTITATAEGRTATIHIVVLPVPIAQLTIEPAAATLEERATLQLRVIARDAAGNELPGRAVNLGSSNSNVAALQEGGLLTAGEPGTAVITAAIDGVTATAQITVIPIPIATLAIEPASFTLRVGEPLTVRVDAYDRHGHGVWGRPVVVRTSDPSIAYLTPDMVVEARSPGQATLTATAEGHTATSVITVIPVPVAAVSVTPGESTIDAEQTVQLSATALDASENVLTGRAITWSSSEPDVATVSATGLVRGVGAGPATITATVDGVQGTASVTVLALPTPFRVYAGHTYTCGVADDDSALCWGDRRHGQLGDGTRVNIFKVNRPQTVLGGLSFSVLSAGNSTTCGVTTAGEAYCWGRDHWGQLGNGGGSETNVPTAVSTSRRFTDIDASETFTCALETGGAMWCWGDNRMGQLGTGDQTQSSAPVEVSGGLRFTAMSAGTSRACGVTTSGAIYCWGSNSDDGLGTGQTSTQLPYSTVPVRVASNVVFRSVSVGYRHTCALAENGQAYCWGLNSDARLGNGTNFGLYASPVAVSGNHQFAQISAGGAHTCAMTTARVPYCWGDNGYGQVGDGTQVTRMVPTAVAGGLRLTGVEHGSITAGFTHSCAVTEAGRGYCWGSNNSGEGGSGTNDTYFVPTPLAPAIKLNP